MWLGPGNRLCLMQFTHCEAGCQPARPDGERLRAAARAVPRRAVARSLEALRHRFESAGALWYRFHSVQTRKTYPHVFQKQITYFAFLRFLRITRNKRYMTSKHLDDSSSFSAQIFHPNP